MPLMLGPVTETIGLISPGDWVDFFRFISESYSGLYVPEFDNRNIIKHIMGKLMPDNFKKFDVVFQPHHKGCEPGEWDETDKKIPDGMEAYYLKANTGPRFLLGGVLSRPFITTKQNEGRFAITSIESSKEYGSSALSKAFSFKTVHHLFHIFEGTLNVEIDGQFTSVRSGETAFIPARSQFSLTFDDTYVRFWSFASGDGIESFISQAGEAYEGLVVPEKAADIDQAKVAKAAESIGMEFVN